MHDFRDRGHPRAAVRPLGEGRGRSEGGQNDRRAGLYPDRVLYLRARPLQALEVRAVQTYEGNDGERRRSNHARRAVELHRGDGHGQGARRRSPQG